MIRLGLIGDNISRSKSPLLHRLAGRLCGFEVSYEALIPADLGRSFDQVFDDCAAGFRGINVTYPYKETVVARLDVPDPMTRAMGACNTVLFEASGPVGHNTDCSGFAGAWRARFGAARPGIVAMAGSGGVGKAIAFALAGLGASHLRLYDPDAARAKALASALAGFAPDLPVDLADSIDQATDGAEGLVNSTPLGMVGYDGSAFGVLPPASWAFDAVYTPEKTQFLEDARAAGIDTMSGYELFFHQGVDAFRHFTGHEVDASALRKELRAQG
ncbi:MAG: shikimate dehydrogenase [Paracoccus sp. (in: a-proteobacteria)]|nr:shikimate dehydrogenase [Paracoccus sp. (in: a-proteobacteria)]